MYVVAQFTAPAESPTVVHPEIDDPLSKNVTVPVAFDGDTEAVMVTRAPGGVGFGLTVRLVDELFEAAAPITMFAVPLTALESCDVATLKVVFE